MRQRDALAIIKAAVDFKVSRPFVTQTSDSNELASHGVDDFELLRAFQARHANRAPSMNNEVKIIHFCAGTLPEPTRGAHQIVLARNLVKHVFRSELLDVDLGLLASFRDAGAILRVRRKIAQWNYEKVEWKNAPLPERIFERLIHTRNFVNGFTPEMPPVRVTYRNDTCVAPSQLLFGNSGEKRASSSASASAAPPPQPEGISDQPSDTQASNYDQIDRDIWELDISRDSAFQELIVSRREEEFESEAANFDNLELG
jgi:hypothetical protein